MLSESSAAVVAQTAGVVAAHAEQITARFYPRMFDEHPELLTVFNQGNQANGLQSRALAASVVAYAVHLIDPNAPSFAPVLERIANKHVSLGVRSEQYTIVGDHLMGAIGEVLGAAVTPEIAAAWGEVYWLFANQLIAEEARLYLRAGIDPEHPWQPWRVTGRTDETADVVSLVLVPAGVPLPAVRPGQYVSVAVDLPDGRRQPRQYTVSSIREDGLQITVRRAHGTADDPDGAVSTFLCDTVRIGDLLEATAPVGDVVLDDGDDPLLLISAGVGITPVAAMVEHLGRTAPDRPVIVAHADRSPETHALRASVLASGAKIADFTALTWYELPGPGELGASVREGLMDLSDVPLPDGVRVFMCGPLPFMRDVRGTLLRRGVPAERIRYEVFGPDLWAQQPEAAA